MNTQALFNINYGLYVLTVNDGEKDTGCIVDALMQVSSEPLQIAVAVDKRNYTGEVIQKTRKFNVSVLTENSKYDIFKRFGFCSGRDSNKFDGFSEAKRSPNGILYVTENTNSFMSAYVKQEMDLGTHNLFIAQLVAAEVLSEAPTISYSYYRNNIKSNAQGSSKKGWKCKLCGYVFEGQDLPEDYTCPICKQGVSVFEQIG